jgi:hypothetical protein
MEKKDDDVIDVLDLEKLFSDIIVELRNELDQDLEISRVKFNVL